MIGSRSATGAARTTSAPSTALLPSAARMPSPRRALTARINFHGADQLRGFGNNVTKVNELSRAGVVDPRGPGAPSADGDSGGGAFLADGVPTELVAQRR